MVTVHSSLDGGALISIVVPRISMVVPHLAEIVMTPSKSGNVTTIKIEKVMRALVDQSRVAHQAGGQHAGLVINKQTSGQY